MKKQLLTLSLVATSTLLAQEDFTASNVGNVTMQNEYCTTCCCVPCCCPPSCPPKKCIDCECYTPQYYDLQCACGVFLDAEFLYWYAKENQLPLALRVETIPVSGDDQMGVTVPTKGSYMDSKWDPGFRVGIGWNSECDGWDLYLSYTYVHNENSKNVSTKPPTAVNPLIGEEALLSPWVAPFLNGFLLQNNDSIVNFNTIKGKWKLSYNVVDLDLGRRYWLSRCFTLRPFFGLRGMWSRIRFKTRQNFITLLNSQNLQQQYKFTDRFKNRYWGVGFLGGFEPTWYFSRCFALYGQADFSLVWGQFRGKRDEKFVVNSVVSDIGTGSYSTKNRFLGGMQAIYDLGVGLRYETTYCCDRYQLTLDLGWEHHYLPNHVHRQQYDESYLRMAQAISGIAGFDEIDTDLGLGGLVVRARFDF